MNFEEHLAKALAEAHKQHIRANTIFLNDSVALVREAYFKFATATGYDTVKYPPMICGLAAHLTDELPDNVAFAVCRTDVETSLEKARREAKQELLDEMKTMQLGEILDLINSEPI